MSLGYADGMIKSIMEGLGSNAYEKAKFASTFDRDSLEVEVGFNENLSEIDLLKMEREFGLDDDSGDADATEVQQRVVIEMANARTLDIFKDGTGDSMVASGGALRLTGYEGSVGASTVNNDCPIRKQEAHKQRVV